MGRRTPLSLTTNNQSNHPHCGGGTSPHLTNVCLFRTANTRLAVRIRGYTEKIDDKEYVRFHRLGIRLKIESGNFHLDNLFNGDPVLGQVGNQVINENSRIFLDEIIPGLEKNLGRLFTEIVNNLLKTATIDDMFPEKV